ncbi:Ionotropic receptor 170, partial [Diabrotica virgifera virgifera]
MRAIFLAVLAFSLQAQSSTISLMEEDSLTGCLQLLVEDSNYAAHFLITSENLTVNFIPRFSKVNLESSNLYLLHSFVGAPNLFTITYNSLDELNTTFLDIFTRRKVSRIMSNFVILTENSTDLLQISQLLWNYSFYKSVILFHNDSAAELYVIDYKNTNCGKIIKYKKINECKDGKYKRRLKPIKPDMKNSFNQCSLTVGNSYLSPMGLYANDSLPGIVAELLEVVSISSGYQFNIYLNDCYINELREFRFNTLFEDFTSGKIDMMFFNNYMLFQNLFFVPL